MALKRAKGNRPDCGPLLLKEWRSMAGDEHWTIAISSAVRFSKRLNRDKITSFALRHSSIVRALGGVPVAVVAQQHDTSA
jgi:hypothetical protein